MSRNHLNNIVNKGIDQVSPILVGKVHIEAVGDDISDYLIENGYCVPQYISVSKKLRVEQAGRAYTYLKGSICRHGQTQLCYETVAL